MSGTRNPTTNLTTNAVTITGNDREFLGFFFGARTGGLHRKQTEAERKGTDRERERDGGTVFDVVWVPTTVRDGIPKKSDRANFSFIGRG